MSSNNNNIRAGMVSQIFANASTNASTNASMNFANVLNFATGTQVFDFDNGNGNTSNNGNTCTLNLSQDYDSYIPQALVINLYPGQNQLYPHLNIYNVCRLFHRMRLVLQVSGQNMLQLSLSLLHELKPAEFHDGKIYLKIPFESLFNQINMNELFFSTVSFVLLDAHEISNYANSFSLVTKVYIHNQVEQSRLNNRNTSRSFIQQIGTLSVSAAATAAAAVTNNRRSFQIQTNSLFGSTKGLLIQCAVTDLQSIKFYVNNSLRFDYGRYLILNSCVKLSENLLYMPFTDHTDFLDRGTNTFSGAINLTQLQSSILCLEFSADQPRIVVHNVYFNYFRQTNGLAGLTIDYSSPFIEQTTLDHPIQPIQPIQFNSNIFDMSGNYVNNAIFSNPNSSANSSSTSSNRNNNISRNTSGATYAEVASHGRTGPSNIIYTENYINNIPLPVINIEYPIPNGIIAHQLINPDRNICYITHEVIDVNQNYMTCSECNNHFMETAIKQWLRQRVGSLRNCPTCREVWTNYTVYINRDELN
jgi:hypothetical protein